MTSEGRVGSVGRAGRVGKAEAVGVVGAGIVGLAVARRLQQVLPGVAVTVVDKEDHVAAHQTGHNSGVVHAGIYYPPGSLKAILCRRGMSLLREYCAAKHLPYEEVGKLVVARRPDERPALDRIERYAVANAVPGLTRCGPGGIAELEPRAVGVAALHSPRTAITDFVAVAESYAADVVAAGGSVRLGFDVRAVRRDGDAVTLVNGRSGGPGTGERLEQLTFDRLVICAGLHSDRVARLAGDTEDPAIVPFRGEYLALVPERRHLVKGLIYPVPDPAYPFLGVHLTRRVDGRVEIGPNAVLALAREGYRRRDVSLGDLRRTLAWPGFRRLAAQHWRTGLGEFAGSAHRARFVGRVRDYLPELTVADVEAAPSGVRAQAVAVDGSLVDDFRLSHLGRITSVRNAPSPAATAALAIAEFIGDRIVEHLRDPV